MARSTTSGRPPTSSIDEQIDKAIAKWVRAGLVEKTDWRGAPRLVTPLPEGPGVTFDANRVEKVLRFFLLLRQIIGRWSGERFRLFDWQVRWVIAPVFGIVRDGKRIIRTLWCEIPRKNGKSTICSGLGLYLAFADGEPGAQVFAAAGDRLQAGLVFRPARSMALNSPELARVLGKGIKQHLLEHPVTGSIFRPLSSEGHRQHGLNVHGAMIDEVHVHKTPDLIDALETGTGSREQPLVAFITTADAGEDGSIYNTKREYVEGCASRTITDESFYGVVFGADEQAVGHDPFADETLAEANPGAGYTVTWEYLRTKASEARQSPAQLNRYLRLHLNIRTKQTTRWLPLDRYDVCGQLVDDGEWHGKIARGGLDLSSTTDLTAFVLKSGDLVHPMFWLPEERIPDLEKRTGLPLGRWAREGYLRLTEGNVVDYAQVRADIVAEVARLAVTVASIGYDPWNASETVQELEAAGYVMVPIRQGYGSLSAPSKLLEALILGSTLEAPLLRHSGHPLLRWNADCVEVRSDDNGNIRPVKPNRVKSSKRIDGIVALIMAVREELLGETEEGSSAAAFFQAITTSCASCGSVVASTLRNCSTCGAAIRAAG